MRCTLQQKTKWFFYNATKNRQWCQLSDTKFGVYQKGGSVRLKNLQIPAENSALGVGSVERYPVFKISKPVKFIKSSEPNSQAPIRIAKCTILQR
jgi:hypothetical protein